MIQWTTQGFYRPTLEQQKKVEAATSALDRRVSFVSALHPQFLPRRIELIGLWRVQEDLEAYLSQRDSIAFGAEASGNAVLGQAAKQLAAVKAARQSLATFDEHEARTKEGVHAAASEIVAVAPKYSLDRFARSDNRLAAALVGEDTGEKIEDLGRGLGFQGFYGNALEKLGVRADLIESIKHILAMSAALNLVAAAKADPLYDDLDLSSIAEVAKAALAAEVPKLRQITDPIFSGEKSVAELFEQTSDWDFITQGRTAEAVWSSLIDDVREVVTIGASYPYRADMRAMFDAPGTLAERLAAPLKAKHSYVSYYGNPAEDRFVAFFVGMRAIAVAHLAMQK